jgi:preprotein translocase subunit Sec61beta
VNRPHRDTAESARVVLSLSGQVFQARRSARKRFKTEFPWSIGSRMARDRDSGFHSAAGLIRYFDQEDEKALKVNPWIVVALCVILSAIVLYATYAWRLS